MRIPAVAAVVGLLLLAPLTGCGSEDPADVAADPALAGSADSPVSDDDPASDGAEPDAPAGMPAAIPAADGPVRSLHLATVLDAGDAPPQLCLGPVAESWPPQCQGIPIDGWRWADARGVFDREGDVRWGSFAVTGTFDGETFTVTDLVPAALYDPMVPEPSTPPTPAVELDAGELEVVVGEVMALPGATSASADEVRVTVEVVHDDGSLQRWADETYGADVVNVVSLLVPAV
ncbi:hypothetical protein [Nocardioides ferulae]|uniref:hypothetical protein n=1 Tax=Nocardioides ferulae TaxID=2340821 RepID=UPI000F86C89A|nr:hypothetical protein [Nocardioides ferulae]